MKHRKVGVITGNGYCDGGQYTSSNGYSYSEYVVTQYYVITLEEFTAEVIDDVAILPFSKSSDTTSSWDVDVGAFFTTDKIVS